MSSSPLISSIAHLHIQRKKKFFSPLKVEIVRTSTANLIEYLIDYYREDGTDCDNYLVHV